ncbi:PR domain zinc finger protein 4 [Bombina bombina]|uniref:PR domain zinc finger protein 4 n=1 Tax=Bombina bombina TaxID=8345 RepID=UPI00235B07F0|nr:PR domain zinc finger protein 4 [Bombina bombina]XP_053574937.1 PR domain zinc finger protein 4 [Bombina bombina]
MHYRMNELNLSTVGMDQLTSSSVANSLSVSGSHLGLAGSPPHNTLAAPGLPVAIPNLGPSLSSLPSALSVMLPMGIGDRGVMCGLPERNYPLPPPPYPHLESSYFRHILPGILSYLADRPPPQYIHPSSLNVDGNGGLSVSNNPPSLDPYQPGGTVDLETSIVSLDSRSVGGHTGQSLHPSDAHDVQLDTGIGMDNVSRVNSPIPSDRMTEELTMEGVTREHAQISSVQRTHESLTVDGNLPPDAVGHASVLPIHSGSLDLPVVLDTDHHMAARSSISESSLSDAIHTVGMSSNPVSVALSTSHQLSSLTSVSLHGTGISLEPVTVSSITQEVPMGGGHVDTGSLTFVPSSLQIDANKENMATMFTIWCTLCDRGYPSDCPEHGPVTFIPDSPIESRARLSLPKQLTLRQSVTGADVGVWAQEAIPVRTCFGPLIGQESQSLEVAGWTDKSANNLWKIYHNGVMEFCIITADENECNWMMFVRKARNPEEQNLVAFPLDGKIYFCTSQDIQPQEELQFYYSRHYARQMGIPEQPELLLCHCGKEFSFYSDFKSHLNSHVNNHLPSETLSSGTANHSLTPSKDRKWKCSMCPRAFSSSSKLNVHYMGHMGMKPHKCEFCSKAFSDPSNLRAHLLIHTGQKNYRCGLCDKSFTQKAHLASHMVIHTGEKNLKCDFCEKMFMRRQDLKQHVLTHTRERQIKCPKCEKHFCRTNHLKKHLNSHEGKRDYVCEKCSKAFLTKYHLTRHLKICKGPSNTPLTPEPDEDDEDSEDEELLGSDCHVFTTDGALPVPT